MPTCEGAKNKDIAQGYWRRGKTRANKKAGRSHSKPIVPHVAGEAQPERAVVGKGVACIYGTTKGHHGFTQRKRNKENEI
jgi:hypothetical protein